MEANLDHRAEQGDGDDGWKWDEVHRICLRAARRYSKDEGQVEDIAQDAMVRAWRGRSSLRDRSALRYWLTTIVRNEAIRTCTRSVPVPVDTLEVRLGSDDERVTAATERADLHAAIERLNERDRLLVRLRYSEDLTQEGIARRLGIPEGTVKVRLHRVRAKLRDHMVSADSD